MPQFVCIDVETANEWFGSICQIGIAIYEDKKLVDEWVSLVNPEVDFSPFNIEIHGITPARVRSAPTFPQVFKQVKNIIKERPIACYGHFDRTAFRQACDGDYLPDMDGPWINLHTVVRRTWPDQFSKGGWGLENVCKFLGIPLLQHHDALVDAKAAGDVFLLAQNITNTMARDWPPLLKPSYYNYQAERKKLEDLTANINPDGPLFGESIVFTGQLSLPRGEAMIKAARLGCTPTNSVTKKTTILVVGDQDLGLVGNDGKSTKQEKADILISKGIPIKIIGEADFLAMAGLID